MDELPILRQLLICEKTIVERDSGNISLVNCHSVRFVKEFPAPVIPFEVFCLLTDGYGTFKMQMRVTRLDTVEDVHQSSFSLTFNDRLQEFSLVIRMEGFEFPIEGRYQIDLLANGELLGMTTLLIRGE